LCKKALGTTAKCIDDTDKCEGPVQTNLCAGGARCCAPPEDFAPLGKMAVKDGKLSGWACDKNSPGAPIDVHIYLDKPAGQGVGTSLRRSCSHCLGKPAPSDVDKTACGCTDAAACNVGFEVDFAFVNGAEPFVGKAVDVYGYAINEGAGGANKALGAAVSVTIPEIVAPTTTPAPTAAPGESPLPTAAPTPDVYQPKALPACFAPNACDSSLPCCDFCTPLPQGVLCQAGGEGGCKADAGK
jgi:hypothetical protein